MSDPAIQSMIAIVGGWYLAWSVFTFFVFARDKRAARLNRMRQPEVRLHLLELLGGFPGAFLAIVLLRHKSKKPSFLFVTLFVTVINIGILYLILRNFIWAN